MTSLALVFTAYTLCPHTFTRIDALMHPLAHIATMQDWISLRPGSTLSQKTT